MCDCAIRRNESWLPNATEPELARSSNVGGIETFWSDSSFHKELTTAYSCSATAMFVPGSPSQGLSMAGPGPGHSDRAVHAGLLQQTVFDAELPRAGWDSQTHI